MYLSRSVQASPPTPPADPNQRPAGLDELKKQIKTLRDELSSLTRKKEALQDIVDEEFVTRSRTYENLDFAGVDMEEECIRYVPYRKCLVLRGSEILWFSDSLAPRLTSEMN